MMPTLTLLGVAHVAVGDQWADLPNTVGSLVVSVLALREDWVSRSELSALVWPDHDETTARRHLRWRLHKVQRVPGFDGIEFERDRVRWPVRSDVHELIRAFCEERWSATVALHRDPLLTGLDWPESRELVEWEEALRRIVRLAAAGARTGAALAAYSAFEGTLRDELRSQPLEETRSLVESVRLRAVSASSAPAVLHAGGSVPHAATHLVGREREAREVQDLLARPGCRLVSLTGFGGIG